MSGRNVMRCQSATLISTKPQTDFRRKRCSLKLFIKLKDGIIYKKVLLVYVYNNANVFKFLSLDKSCTFNPLILFKEELSLEEKVFVFTAIRLKFLVKRSSSTISSE